MSRSEIKAPRRGGRTTAAGRAAAANITLNTVPAAASQLGCSEMHVYRQIASGELRAVDISTPGARRSKTRIRSDDLADYIERRTRTAAEMRALVLDATGLRDAGSDGPDV